MNPINIPITIPTKAQVPAESRKYFDYFLVRLGMMPNLYAVMAWSEPGLTSYLQFQKRKTSLTRRETIVISLVVSATHRAGYCLGNYTMIAKLNGLDDEQITEICAGTARFDPRLDALARLVHNLLANHTKADEDLIRQFFCVGFQPAHLFDVAMTIGDNMISNTISNTLTLPADSPLTLPADNYLPSR
jgi:AhpD family alkylhydroperoxidase